MKRTVVFSLAFLAAGWPQSFVFAEPKQTTSAPASVRERISIDLEEGQALGLFGSFAKILGCELQLDPVVASRKVSITLQRVRLSLALDTLCDSVGCDWRLESGNETAPCVLMVSNLPAGQEAREAADIETLLSEPVTMRLADADFAEVVRSFGSLLGARLDLPAKLSGDGVTLDLQQTEVRLALDAILGPAGYDWSLEEANGERVFKVWKE